MVAAGLFVALLAGSVVYAKDCPCGWRIGRSNELYTHSIDYDFSQYPDMENLLSDKRASSFLSQWMIYDFWHNSDNPNIRLNAKYDAKNVHVRGGELHLIQKAYSDEDRQAFRATSVAGVQSREVDILHGTFRAVMKVSGATGGSCASFFWYHDDKSEIDIEAVTQGTSLVNNTINYTTQPSLDSDGKPITNATLSVPISTERGTDISIFHEYRFDCDSEDGVEYYLDSRLVHSDTHSMPKIGGNLQLKLWADGNKWWSGIPSKTDVILSVKSVKAFFNTTSSEAGKDVLWTKKCHDAGGPGKTTTCDVHEKVVMNGQDGSTMTTLTDDGTVGGGSSHPAISRASRLAPINLFWSIW